MMELKPKTKFLLDFDGVVVDAHKPDGTSYYPEIGPIRPGIKNFLLYCKTHDIRPYIWSARTNSLFEHSHEDFPIYGEKAKIQIEKFMIENNLYFYDFLLEHKPVHTGGFKFLIDDNALNGVDAFAFTNLIFGS